MTEKNSRRVVIIDRVNSDIIDQAILILKSSAPKEIPISTTAPVVVQAQEIIDNYIGRVEQMRCKTQKKQRRDLRLKRVRQLGVSLVAFAVTVAAAFAAGWILNTIF